MCSAALCTSIAEELFIICKSGKSADFPDLLFHGRGHCGKQHLQRRFLRKRGAAGKALLICALIRRYAPPSPDRGKASVVAIKFPAKVQSVRACSLPLGGAVAQRLRGYKWRSEKSVKAIAPTGAALAFLCFDFFFRIVKGEQPLARCGVGGVQR